MPIVPLEVGATRCDEGVACDVACRVMCDVACGVASVVACGSACCAGLCNLGGGVFHWDSSIFQSTLDWILVGTWQKDTYVYIVSN